MARQTALALALLLAFVTAAAASPARPQSDEQQKPGKTTSGEKHGDRSQRLWWNDETVRAEIGLRAEQIAELDKIFKTYIEKAHPLRLEVNELDKTIERMITSNSTDGQLFTQQVKRVEARRSELNELRTIMLYRLRRVLNAEQNTKFQAWWDRREAARKKQDGDRRK